ncbi:MAG: hypothetical protein HN368_22095, partial [Spirochaetales bacterium]|nr:hypothetical protein [Spirochaetales bacterium]
MITSGIFSTSRRVFPGQNLVLRSSLSLYTARNEVISCQVLLQDHGASVDTRCSLSIESLGTATSIQVRIRRVGFVPVPQYNTDTPLSELDRGGNLLGFVPDALLDENEIELSPGASGMFWITL